MRQLLKDCYEALRGVPASVTRGWPAVSQPLPHILFSLLEDRLLSTGERLMAVGIRVRATSPEAADELSDLVDAALSGLDLKRTGCLDNTEHDRGSYLKVLRYERLLPPAQLPRYQLTLMGREYPGGLIHYRKERALLKAEGLSAAQPLPLTGRPIRADIRLTLPLAALSDLEAAWRSGDMITLSRNGQPGSARLVAYSLTAGRLTLEMQEA